MRKNIHFIGIGGVSMCGLAVLTALEGAKVTGSDLRENTYTRHLQSLGIPVTVGEVSHTLLAERADLVVYTAAVPEGQKELVAARRAGVRCLSRAAYMGEFMRGYTRRIGVAGVHGKSTVTGMLAAIFAAACADATVLCGATLSEGRPYRPGGRDTLLFEACEYQDSFLSFFPTVAVLLNLEWEHVDYFQSEAALAASMRAYAKKARLVVANGEDARLMEALADLPCVTYGFTNGGYTLRGQDLYHGTNHLGTLSLRVFGRHNLQNALAAAATAHAMGVATEHILRGLAAFSGVARRMTYRGKLNGAAVYDDYAHHSTEVAASIQAARQVCSGRLLCAFQGHTYTRTQAFFSAYVQLFSQVDAVFFVPIYAARENSIEGVSAEALAAAVPGAEVCTADAMLANCLAELARPGDVVLIMGAGDIDSVFDYLPLTD